MIKTTNKKQESKHQPTITTNTSKQAPYLGQAHTECDGAKLVVVVNQTVYFFRIGSHFVMTGPCIAFCIR